MAGDALVPTGKKKVGAPSLFTPEVCKKIIDAVKAGNYDYIAAEAAGIDRTTFFRWMKRGKKEGEGEYWEFCNAVTKAENEAETRIVGGVVVAGLADPKQWQWWLERKCPERWGRDTYQVKQLQAQVDQLSAELKLFVSQGNQKAKKRA